MTGPELQVRLALPYQAPPPSLSLNWRGHWSVRHAATRQVRSDVTVLARQAGLHRYGPGEVAHVRVQLVWAPGDRRRRDADNLSPFVKVCVDSLARSRPDLVGIDLVADDVPEFVTVEPTVILPPPAPKGMRLDLWLRFAAQIDSPVPTIQPHAEGAAKGATATLSAQTTAVRGTSTPTERRAVSETHAMHYRAGTAGMARLGLRDSAPHWYCTCGRWRFEAKPVRRAATGNNLKAAQLAHASHAASPNERADQP